MSDGTLFVKIPQSDGTPEDYLVSGAAAIDLLAVSADFNGAGAAGNYVPVIQVVNEAGEVMLTFRGDTETAGDSASYTFAPFLEAATSASPFVVSDVKEYLTNVSHQNAIPFGVAGFNWKHTSGATLLNLTDVFRPKIITPGLYSVTMNCEAATSLTWDVGGYWVLQPDIDSNGTTLLGKAQYTSPVTAPATPFPLTFSSTQYMLAGDKIEVVASNRDSHGHDFYITHAWVVRLA